MATISLKKARKILGKSAIGVSDEEIKQNIKTAIFLAELFIEKYPGLKKNYSTSKV